MSVKSHSEFLDAVTPYMYELYYPIFKTIAHNSLCEFVKASASFWKRIFDLERTPIASWDEFNHFAGGVLTEFWQLKYQSQASSTPFSSQPHSSRPLLHLEPSTLIITLEPSTSSISPPPSTSSISPPSLNPVLTLESSNIIISLEPSTSSISPPTSSISPPTSSLVLTLESSRPILSLESNEHNEMDSFKQEINEVYKKCIRLSEPEVTVPNQIHAIDTKIEQQNTELGTIRNSLLILSPFIHESLPSEPVSISDFTQFVLEKAQVQLKELSTIRHWILPLFQFLQPGSPSDSVFNNRYGSTFF